MEVRRAVTLAHPPERVWSMLAAADGLARWLGGEVDLEVRAGAKGVVRSAGEQRRVVVDEVDPPRRLVLRWRRYGLDLAAPLRAEPASTVVLELDAVEGGTRLRVTETADDVLLGSRA